MSFFASVYTDAVLAITRTDAFASCERWKGQTKNCPLPLTAKVAVFVNVCCEKPCTRGIVADYLALSKSEVYRTVLLLALK